MAAREILLLGDERLYERASVVTADEVAGVRGLAADMHDTVADFRARHGWGRAIAAPQVGVAKRVVCVNADERVTLINPELIFEDDVRMTVWDDCMSFPELLVRVERFRRCTVWYRDLDWVAREVVWEGDDSELIQHEVDHLDGVLTIQRMVGERGIVLRRQRGQR